LRAKSASGIHIGRFTMLQTDKDTVASFDFSFTWHSAEASHTDVMAAPRVNFWRDCFPEDLAKSLIGKKPGDLITHDFAPGQLTGHWDEKQIFTVPITHVETGRLADADGKLRVGRFYPRGILKGISNVFPGNIAPFRCIDIDSRAIRADFNHPLAKTPLHLEATVGRVRPKAGETGGSCTDWMEKSLDGPGMQASCNGTITDFLGGKPFAREDESNDSRFYTGARITTHIDETAAGVISHLYEKLLKPGDEVLDLMSSWKSHLPDALALASVVGLGMNREELDQNDRLTQRVVHDLNVQRRLPFAEQRFDAVICTVSVEYLTDPVAVFSDVARVLKPGGRFIVTMSNRWFPPKVVALWKELHEFERMAWVLTCLRQAGFASLHTYSRRGLPRPIEDKYFPQMLYSDPVYAVWGQKDQRRHLHRT
jgi:SAM-dependent methyltransferase/FKBP-type peptidyl-prolyl cis-trans isomerase 2